MFGLATQAGHVLAKMLGTRHQSSATDTANRTEGRVSTCSTSDDFVDSDASSSEWLRDQLPSPDGVRCYFTSLFPFLGWVPHYNVQWLAGDVVSGLTIGAIIVPQGMAYASLAKLDPQFGLYSSFFGVVIYWIFGTSKDISIGNVAVLSSIVGSVVDDITSRPGYQDMPPHVIASALSIVAGSVVLALGLLRCGWIVDLISIPSLAAFMTGSAITIASSQLPALFGVSGFSNRDSPYLVIINTIKRIPETKLDAAIGLSALFALYLIRYGLDRASKRFPSKRRIFFFVKTMRTVVIILFFTFVSWLVNRNRRDKTAFRVLGSIPKGFRQAGVPEIPAGIVPLFASHLPVAIIVMLAEHIAISKSFGRINNYIIDPSQEMVAIGMANLLGPLLGAYPTTGSFSRTAVNSEAGVRTPAGGLMSGLVVFIATYFLTGAFFYIPNAALSAVIIHAVGDLMTSPGSVYQFWRISPLEVPIFLVSVFVSVFQSIEDGLYVTVALSLAILLYRILKARGRFLGKIRLHSVLGDRVIGEGPSEHEEMLLGERDVFIPLHHEDGSNPGMEIESPYPGVFIFRFSEGFNYSNASSSLDYMTGVILAETRRTSPEEFKRPGDRPWNHPGPHQTSKSGEQPKAVCQPTLQAVILDFSCVNNVDVTSIQCLVDARKQLDQHASPGVVDWHVACIGNRWTKRALAAAGFGVHRVGRPWKPVLNMAEIGQPQEDGVSGKTQASVKDEEMGQELGCYSAASAVVDEKDTSIVSGQSRAEAAVYGRNRPLFHVDLTSALQSAVANVVARQEFRREEGMTTAGMQ
ncbi:sulfate permease [Ophiocordyceps camponoti-floridani]|uniref:Sulfate permease n=1 Tax=Ophiocordyceps camponoti-floridani TaxID=2030778 RepID=A0A8H4VAQ7_9HYPO|nr:sulfate permease [Ophiocordyceps camponoti-floridani]